MQINNLFKNKSKCFKLKKLYVKRIFEKINVNFCAEININKTSILEYVNKEKNCLLHFKDKSNCDLFRTIRDNSEKITNIYKNTNSKNYNQVKDDDFNLLLNYLKQKTCKENIDDPVLFKNLINKKISKINIKNIYKLSQKISNYYITDFSCLDIIKAFNEKDNLIIIHFGDAEYTNFLKLHGSYMQFHKAKIAIIGDHLNNFKINLKKYGFKPYKKNIVGNLIWVKNF